MQLKLGISVVPDATDPTSTVEQQLARLATDLCFSTLLLGVPAETPIAFVRRLGEDIAPKVREMVS